ncbi:TonB-dependent receptor [Steroidobacter agaridevorans]|uniref:TonB-dependent receptor n=1 Tax=Steroidobacter agaridevorans TaxID=2695856 RepID=UPI00132B480F|nr:TonB-dependent receptor [Steroidobacter agaridevorans]GFE87614.1 TonB-dependent receptor [Steroidobacter agaridevorans]
MALSAAPAQSQNASGSSSQVEEVVVTGLREQLKSSQARKADAEELLDSITASDIGALPDRSVTEVLQRIPGLAIGRVPEARDADRIAVEGAGVTVRGLSWVRSELNGRSAFSAKESRALGFEDIPPELMAAVDVYKNPSAALIEGGMAGVVDLRTRLPFDSPDRVLAASAEYAVGDLANKERPSGSFLYSDRWNTGIGEMGFLISSSASQLTTQTHTLHIDRYYARTNLPGYEGQTVFAPGGIGWRELTVDRERLGGSLALQWRPSDTVDVSLQYFMADATFEQNENASWSEQGNALTGSNLQVANGYLVGGRIANSFFAGSARYNERESTNHDAALHLTWHPGERWRFDLDVQRVFADADIMDLTLGSPTVDQGNPDALAFDLRLNGSNEPRIGMAPNSVMTDPDQHYYGWAMDHYEKNDADAWAYRADGEYTFDNSDWMDRIRFGIRHENYSSTTRETGYRWGTVAQNWGGGDTRFGDASVPYIQQGFSDWFHGGQAPSAYVFPHSSAYSGRAAFESTIHSVETFGTNCCDWTPWNGDFADTTPGNDGLGVNTQNQKSWAGYVAAHFGKNKFDGNVGVRVVRTENLGTGLLTFSGADVVGSPDESAFANGASYEATDENTYTDVLPSLNLRYKVRDDVFLRFAVARSLSRPDFPLLLPAINVTAKLGLMSNGVCNELPEGAKIGTCVYQYNGFAGNPDLEPMRSWQYDVSAEWYINPTNSLTGAIFYKQLEGFMETSLNSTVDYTNNGQTRSVRVLRPENQGSGYVQGFEVAYNSFFDFLPGFGKNFGARAAFTYVESGGTRNIAANPYDENQRDNSALDGYPLEGLSKTSYNAELYYSTQRFEARLAYNWRERYVLTMAAANLNIPAWADDYGQLDGSVTWNVSQKLKVGLQAVNLTDAPYRILVDNFVDNTGLTYHNWVSADRRYNVFVRASF